jgi:prefoldin subunit 5
MTQPYCKPEKQAMTLKALKEKVDALEQQLLAISSLNDICQQSMFHGNNPIKLESCAELLNHLIDPAMYQIESVRLTVNDMNQHAEEKLVNGDTHVPD